MQTLIYLLYKPEAESQEAFASLLHHSVIHSLLALKGVKRLRMAVVDSDIEPARALRLQTSARLPDAVLTITADDEWPPADLTTTLHKHGLQLAGYQVTETEPLVNHTHSARHGERVYGMCQIALLQKPPRLSYAEWLDIWQNSHTRIAIDNQSTFGYRQNVIVSPLTEKAPGYDAIVVENFPPEAMTSSHAFYNADGDDTRLKKHTDAMMASCNRFIDFDRIDAIPMSEYVYFNT